MKIWLDTLPIPLYAHGDCDCIIDCGRSDNSILPLAEDDIKPICISTLEKVTPLHIQACDDDRWLVCSPTGSGLIAVCDFSALFLLEQFRQPATLVQVMHAVPGWSHETVEKAATLFYKLGFLRTIDTPSHLPIWDEPQTLTAWLHITNACNLRCHYCYLQKSSESMAEDTAYQAVDAIFRSAIRHDIKRIMLKYAGGEASLHMASVMSIHDYATQLAQQHTIALRAMILSNGVALSQRAIDNLKSRHIDVMISLDGLGAYHDSQRPFKNGRGSFQYVARTIDRLLTNDIVPHIAITVSRRNLDGLPGLIEFVLERGIPFSLNYYRDNTYAASFHDLRFEEGQMIAAMHSVFGVIERNMPGRSLLGCLVDKADMSMPHHATCGVGQSYFVVDQHGGVAKCQADIKRTVTTIEADDPLQAIRDDRDGVQGLLVEEKEGCRTCEWRYWCAGGCPLLTYQATGRYDVKSPNCNIYKALFPEVLRLEALRLLRYQLPIVLQD